MELEQLEEEFRQRAALAGRDVVFPRARVPRPTHRSWPRLVTVGAVATAVVTAVVVGVPHDHRNDVAPSSAGHRWLLTDQEYGGRSDPSPSPGTTTRDWTGDITSLDGPLLPGFTARASDVLGGSVSEVTFRNDRGIDVVVRVEQLTGPIKTSNVVLPETAQHVTTSPSGLELAQDAGPGQRAVAVTESGLAMTVIVLPGEHRETVGRDVVGEIAGSIEQFHTSLGS